MSNLLENEFAMEHERLNESLNRLEDMQCFVFDTQLLFYVGWYFGLFVRPELHAAYREAFKSV